MKRLFIILPVLISLLVSAGLAAADTQVKAAPAQLLAAVSDDFETMVPAFAKAADDGGALGEKEKCRAMLLEPNDNPVEIHLSQGQITARPTLWASLTAIREDEV